MEKQTKGLFFCDAVACPHCGKILEPVTVDYLADRITEWKTNDQDEWMIKTANDGKYTNFTAIVCRDCLKVVGILPFTPPVEI
ncbi:hypothetical protein [Sphaerochaeta sp. PS]|uniref:hypothetical protein n=1 Tax=Sphaerochaeta sp. PS TaxID=3076336 RepID=UPI0028A445E6|nr:hypothetical protein [Sphaerochaeta sp. PS]MDT4761840.1 hypothetical protein [Sphaerochaeta sp. PS]